MLSWRSEKTCSQSGGLIPAIALTGYAEIEGQSGNLRAGYQAHLQAHRAIRLDHRSGKFDQATIEDRMLKRTLMSAA